MKCTICNRNVGLIYVNVKQKSATKTYCYNCFKFAEKTKYEM